MIAAWMLFAIVIGALFGAAALAAARAAAAAGRPTRLIWSAALLAAAFWPLFALVIGHTRDPEPGAGSLTLPIAIVAQHSRELATRTWVGYLVGALDVILPVLWITLTTVLLARLARALSKLRRERESWRPDRVEGVSVRLSHDVGPAVVGLGTMEIVLPAWALALDRPLLEMVLRHEEEHRRAHDPRLLFGAALTVALIPWNPVLWWCARRLRLAIELDCDSRVLSVHRQPERYGLLLMMMAQRSEAGASSLAPALTNPISNLERRIIAMRRTLPRFARTQLLAFSALAVTMVVVACSVDSPESVRASSSADTPRLMSDSSSISKFLAEHPARPLEGNPAPVYPEELEKARIEGEVIVQFVLDPTGSPDMQSIKVVKSSHPLFTAAVRKTLPSMRFEPARVDGRAVRQLVQVPFGFKVPVGSTL